MDTHPIPQSETQYIKTGNYNTNYYRRNKVQRFCVLSCSHCEYETTGPKSALNAHIWSKHTPENKRPFQCLNESCNRGFASKANLHKHLIKTHNIKMPKTYDKDILVYEVIVNNILISIDTSNLSQNDKNRMKYYLNHRFIPTYSLSHQSDNNNTVSLDHIYYDYAMNRISIIPHTRKELLIRYSSKSQKVE